MVKGEIQSSGKCSINKEFKFIELIPLFCQLNANLFHYCTLPFLNWILYTFIITSKS